MFPTESAIDQFLLTSGFLGFLRMQKGLNSLVVEQKAQNLTTGVWFPVKVNNLSFLCFEPIFISDWLFTSNTNLSNYISSPADVP